MLADNLKPDYYRSKGRPPLTVISDHHHSLGNTVNNAHNVNNLTSSEDLLFLDSVATNCFFRQASLSSASLLGDLNGKPLFYMPTLAPDVDPLLPLTKSSKSSSVSSNGTSPVALATAIATGAVDLPERIFDLSDMTISTRRCTKPKHRRGQTNNSAFSSPQSSSPPKPSKSSNNSFCEKDVPKTPPTPPPTTKLKEEEEAQEALVIETISTIEENDKGKSVKEDNDADDDDDDDFIVVTSRKKNRQARSAVKANNTMNHRLNRPQLQNPPPPPPPPPSIRRPAQPPKVTATTSTVLSKIPVPERLSKQYPGLVSFMSKAWTNFPQTAM